MKTTTHSRQPAKAWLVVLVLGWIITAGWAWHSHTQNQQQITTLTQQLTQSQQETAVATKLVDGYKQYLVTHSGTLPEDAYLTGYQLPIPGKQPPYSNPGMMPGADRSYRGGVHEGMDFAVVTGTPVEAVGAGRIIRVDHDYVQPSLAKLDALSDLTQSIKFTPDDIFDTFRGRQIWLLLPGNVIIRYCHLSSTENLTLGQTVTKGQVLGHSGSSGTLDGAQHLHLEIRVGNTFLGNGQPYANLVAATKHFFTAEGQN